MHSIRLSLFCPVHAWQPRSTVQGAGRRRPCAQRPPSRGRRTRERAPPLEPVPVLAPPSSEPADGDGDGWAAAAEAPVPL
ncbi:MAG: hypothetical protein ACKVI4_14865, partial [Actinomycetales bacterium]